MDWKPGDKVQLRGGDYDECELIRRVGSGGDGDAWLAAYKAFNSKVLLKRSSAWDGADVEAFHDEAKAVAGLDHEAIAKFHRGFTMDDGSLVLMREWVPGVSLADRASPLRGMNLVERLDLVKIVLDAMAYAHARGCVHGDIKPANIVVGADRRVKLIDFSPNRTRIRLAPGLTIGATPGYEIPEDVTFPTRLSDVWQLGLLLVELLCGPKVRDAFGHRRTQSFDDVFKQCLRDVTRGRSVFEMELTGRGKEVDKLCYAYGAKLALQFEPEARADSAGVFASGFRSARVNLSFPVVLNRTVSLGAKIGVLGIEAVQDVGFSADGTMLVVLESGRLSWYDATQPLPSKWRRLQALESSDLDKAVLIASHPRNRRVVCVGCDDGLALAVRLEESGARIVGSHRCPGSVRSIVWSEDGRTLSICHSGSNDDARMRVSLADDNGGAVDGRVIGSVETVVPCLDLSMVTHNHYVVYIVNKDFEMVRSFSVGVGINDVAVIKGFLWIGTRDRCLTVTDFTGEVVRRYPPLKGVGCRVRAVGDGVACYTDHEIGITRPPRSEKWGGKWSWERATYGPLIDVEPRDLSPDGKRVVLFEYPDGYSGDRFTAVYSTSASNLRWIKV